MCPLAPLLSVARQKYCGGRAWKRKVIHFTEVRKERGLYLHMRGRARARGRMRQYMGIRKPLKSSPLQCSMSFNQALPSNITFNLTYSMYESTDEKSDFTIQSPLTSRTTWGPFLQHVNLVERMHHLQTTLVYSIPIILRYVCLGIGSGTELMQAHPKTIEIYVTARGRT